MIKPNTRVRHIVTRTEGIVINTYRAGRMGGKGTMEYVRVRMPDRFVREWKIESVEEVRG
jgi:hypothetical protein